MDRNNTESGSKIQHKIRTFVGQWNSNETLTELPTLGIGTFREHLCHWTRAPRIVRQRTHLPTPPQVWRGIRCPPQQCRCLQPHAVRSSAVSLQSEPATVPDPESCSLAPRHKVLANHARVNGMEVRSGQCVRHPDVVKTVNMGRSGTSITAHANRLLTYMSAFLTFSRTRYGPAAIQRRQLERVLDLARHQ